jgi:hypothetical protein
MTGARSTLHENDFSTTIPVTSTEEMKSKKGWSKPVFIFFETSALFLRV